MTAADPKLSGINLSRPSDSGINLQTGAGLGLGQADSIELAPSQRRGDPDDQRTAKPPRPSRRSPSRRWRPPPRPSSRRARRTSSTTPTSRSTSRSSDADSDDKTVQLEAASDFDLEDSDTGSEVFAIDEEAVDQNASTAMAPSAFAEDDEDEEDDGFDSAVSSEMTSRLVELGVIRRSRNARLRPWCSPARPRPSGAASGSACWASPPSVLFFASFVASRPGSKPLRVPVRRDHGLGIGPRDRRHVRRLIGSGTGSAADSRGSSPMTRSSAPSTASRASIAAGGSTSSRRAGLRTIVPERSRNEWFVHSRLMSASCGRALCPRARAAAARGLAHRSASCCSSVSGCAIVPRSRMDECQQADARPCARKTPG